MHKDFNTKTIATITFLFLVMTIFFGSSILNISSESEIYFIDVGQGDSQLLNIDGFQVLIDGGPPNGKLIRELGNILPFYDRYIDLVVLTHPQIDHFGGLVEVVRRYKVGLILYTGRQSQSQAANDFEKFLKQENIKGLKIAQGDSIRYKNMNIDVLLPDSETIQSEDLNDSSIVLLVDIDNTKSLFTGDISSAVEKHIIDKINNLDILKVAHHGSKYSTHSDFLNKANPKLSVINVGKNSYGHPTDEVLNRLDQIGSQVFRTDKDGTINTVIEDSRIKVFTISK